MTGLYAVDIVVPPREPDPSQPAGSARWRGQGATRDRVIVIAASAAQAETIALTHWQAWSAGNEAATPEVEVGRLGNYDPGMAGAGMAGASPVLAIAAMRIDR